MGMVYAQEWRMNPVGCAKTVVEKPPSFIPGFGPRAKSHSDMECLPGSHCHMYPPLPHAIRWSPPCPSQFEARKA